MRKVRCGDCGKIYDFDVDDFCPKCGAFNQPQKRTQISADGSIVRAAEPVVRRDGINERNHAGSFVHAELHQENRQRRGTSLAKGAKRTPAAPPKMPKTIKTLAGDMPSTRQSQSGNSLALIGLAAFALFLYILSAIING